MSDKNYKIDHQLVFSLSPQSFATTLTIPLNCATLYIDNSVDIEKKLETMSEFPDVLKLLEKMK